MYCPNCASQVHNNTKFCTHCGINLTREDPQSEEMIKLLEKCHNGYLSTIIGLGLVITSLLIIIAAMMLHVLPVAISSLIFLGWAIPAIAQGIGKWLSAKSEMRTILGVRSSLKGEEQSQKTLPSEGARTDSPVYAGSVTEVTTASLDQRA